MAETLLILLLLLLVEFNLRVRFFCNIQSAELHFWLLSTLSASFSSRDSDEGERKKKRRRDSSEEDSKKRRRHLSLKRRRESEDSDDDDDSDDSEEEDRPIRKRVNRIDSDDSDEEEEEKKKNTAEKESEESKRPQRVGLDEEDEAAAALVKGTSALDYYVVDLPPTNGQSPMKGPEGLISRPPGGVVVGAAATSLMAHIGPKNPAAATAVAMATNGLVPQEMPPPDEDEDDLLGVTDLVDYVCNSEQL